MKKVVFLSLLGLFLEIISTRAIISVAWDFGYRHQIHPGLYALVSLWWIGITNSFGYYIRRIGQLLNPALKLSPISWLATKSGFIGMFVLVIYIVFILVIACLYE